MKDGDATNFSLTIATIICESLAYFLVSENQKNIRLQDNVQYLHPKKGKC